MASTTGKNRPILAGLVAQPVTDTPTLERGGAPTQLSHPGRTGRASKAGPEWTF